MEVKLQREPRRIRHPHNAREPADLRHPADGREPTRWRHPIQERELEVIDTRRRSASRGGYDTRGSDASRTHRDTRCGSEYKHRKTSEGWGRNDGHRHQAAMRYMVKILLLDIWKKWRAAEGLPVRPSYHEEKLGHVHGGVADAGGPVNPAPLDDDPEVDAELRQIAS